MLVYQRVSPWIKCEMNITRSWHREATPAILNGSSGDHRCGVCVLKVDPSVAACRLGPNFQSYLLFTFSWCYWWYFYVSLPCQCLVLRSPVGYSPVRILSEILSVGSCRILVLSLHCCEHLPAGVSVGLQERWSPTMLCWVHVKKRASGSKRCTSAFSWQYPIYRYLQ